MLDKKIWMLWAELRANEDVDAIETPTGYIPIYDNLAKLFKENLGIDYSLQDYTNQFTVHTPELLAKYDRIEQIYRGVDDTPNIVFQTFSNIRERLNDAKQKHGDYINPFDLK